VQVNETLVDLQLKTIPSLGAFTARLATEQKRSKTVLSVYQEKETYSFTGGDPEDLGWKADGALDTELLVLGTVDEVSGDCTEFRCKLQHIIENYY
jgi:hypothetical protein